MKKIIFLFITMITVSSQAFAQTDDVYKTIAKETCECIGKKNYDYDKADQADVQMTLGLCMLESAQKNNLPIDISDTEAMTELGKKVGVLMVSVCPDVFKVFIERKQPVVEEDETEVMTVTGTVKSIEEKDFLYINLKDESNTNYRFIWLSYFEGSDDFKADPKKLIGKKVAITYTLLEALHPKSKIYYNLNIISGLQIK